MSTFSSHRKLIPITENAIRVREWEKNNLPIEQSSLALDLFLFISYNTLIGKPLTLKVLFHSLEYSEAGIRKQLRRLLQDEWCLITGNEVDRRLRYVVAQPKMLQALNAYSRVLTANYRPSAARKSHTKQPDATQPELS